MEAIPVWVIGKVIIPVPIKGILFKKKRRNPVDASGFPIRLLLSAPGPGLIAIHEDSGIRSDRNLQ